MDRSFSRASRIRKKSDFSVLRRDAKKYVAPRFLCFYLKKGDAMPRLALSCSTRYGNSVERNQWKRWIREWFRNNRERLKGRDLHFVARGKAPRREKAQVLKYKQLLDDELARLREYFGH